MSPSVVVLVKHGPCILATHISWSGHLASSQGFYKDKMNQNVISNWVENDHKTIFTEYFL